MKGQKFKAFRKYFIHSLSPFMYWGFKTQFFKVEKVKMNRKHGYKGALRKLRNNFF